MGTSHPRSRGVRRAARGKGRSGGVRCAVLRRPGMRSWAPASRGRHAARRCLNLRILPAKDCSLANWLRRRSVSRPLGRGLLGPMSVRWQRRGLQLDPPAQGEATGVKPCLLNCAARAFLAQV